MNAYVKPTSPDDTERDDVVVSSAPDSVKRCLHFWRSRKRWDVGLAAEQWVKMCRPCRVPPTWGACGVEGCGECWPLFNEANEPITDNFGVPL